MLWTESLTTGVRKIDELHREFFDRLHSLMEDDLCSRGSPEESLDLVEICAMAFFDEEQRLHEAYEYPRAESHKIQHDGYLNAFRRVKGKLISEGLTLANVLAFNRCAVECIKRHILEHDRDFAEYCKMQADL
ncbi:hypothetical protein LJC31_08645 [Synergistaceae bacterium OttesenSCG-928-I11]|nr:hypothetical protein [Synergistaceae bacterium OttesenSCG-928-I11]